MGRLSSHPTFRSSALEATTVSSVLSLLSLRLDDIQVFYVVQTVDKQLWGDQSGWFSAEVQLGVIGIACHGGR